MSNEKYHNCEEILARVKIFLNVHTGKDLAKALGVSENAISTWKKRKTLDIGKILLKCEGINQDWLISGKGAAQPSITNTQVESEEMYRLKYEALIEEYAKEMNEKNNIIIKLQHDLLIVTGGESKKPVGFPKKKQA